MTNYRPVTTSAMKRSRYICLLWILTISAFFLAGNLAYYYLANAKYFPIETVKVAANYEHVSHKELETILAKYIDDSFFFTSTSKLKRELESLMWVNHALVERVWPNTLKIKLIEKKPVAIWDKSLLTADGKFFDSGLVANDLLIPHFKGPRSQYAEVLQVYGKLSKMLSRYGLNATGLQLSENQSWILTMSGGITIYLGKKELTKRLLRFCKAYPAVFAQKAEQLVQVDLRYPYGMAVQWKQQTER